MTTTKRKKAKPVEVWGSFHTETWECPDGIFPGKPWPGAIAADGYRILYLTSAPEPKPDQAEVKRLRFALASIKSITKDPAILYIVTDALKPRRTTKPRRK